MKLNTNKVIVTWLYIGVAMILIQVLLGGITRLTGSGLSITEWKPIVGALYPKNITQWQTAFDNYKQIAQYKYLNADFNLNQFKFIFFWEWLHRNWARFIAVVFFVPFVFFITRSIILAQHVNRFIIIFIIGALQGLVGWLMVSSGINDTNLYVDHFKLAIHFITALLALVVVYWQALYFNQLSINSNLDNNANETKALYQVQKKSESNIIILIFILLFFQLILGAFMAGLKAAAAAPTWPSINGSYWPIGLFSNSIFSNAISVHFLHRNLAYVITAIIFFVHFKKLISKQKQAHSFIWPFIIVSLQVVLGICAVLYAPHPMRNAMGSFEWSALIHQFVALLLLLSLVRAYFFTKHEHSI
jgi:heme a synthase